MSGRLKLLYVGGHGRSGSTLLDRVVGQIPGFTSVGELRYMWQRGVAEDQRCGCGSRFLQCEFWMAVGDEAFGGWSRLDVQQVLHLQRAVDRYPLIPLIVAPWTVPAFRRRLERYSEYLLSVVAAIHRVSGSRVVIDSSMSPSHAFLLRGIAGVDLRMVHLVRDSRGVAHSWTKRVRRPEIVETDAYMPTYSPLNSGARWMAYNALFELLGRLGVPRLAVRYEEFLKDPRRQTIYIARHVGETVGDEELAFLGPNEVELGINHTAAGNPMRFKLGRIPLKLDEEWRLAMDPGQSRAVTLLTWPLLRRYGYAGRGSGHKLAGSPT